MNSQSSIIGPSPHGGGIVGPTHSGGIGGSPLPGGGSQELAPYNTNNTSQQQPQTAYKNTNNTSEEQPVILTSQSQQQQHPLITSSQQQQQQQLGLKILTNSMNHSTMMSSEDISTTVATSETVAQQQQPIIGGIFAVGKKLGSGSFGEIFWCYHLLTHEEFAVKIESADCKHPQLLYETKLLKHLQGGPGISQVIYSECDSERNILVMDLLGPSLEDLFNYCKRKFSLRTVCLIAEQLISRVEYLHSRNFIHRDIKPDNFLIGRKKFSIIYMIDYGLAKKYRDPKTHQHIPFREGKNLTGTARYASINAHSGAEQSRRDDLEAIAYVLLYFYLGILPWQGIKVVSKQEKYSKIRDKKKSIPIETLCKSCPPQFASYLTYTRKLKFEDRPDYASLRRIFRDIMNNSSWCPLEPDEDPNKFDWEKINGFDPRMKFFKPNRETQSSMLVREHDSQPLTNLRLSTDPIVEEGHEGHITTGVGGLNNSLGLQGSVAVNNNSLGLQGSGLPQNSTTQQLNTTTSAQLGGNLKQDSLLVMNSSLLNPTGGPTGGGNTGLNNTGLNNADEEKVVIKRRNKLFACCRKY